MKLKIGDWVIWNDKEASDNWGKVTRIFLYGKVAKIIYIDKDNNKYLFEFKEYVMSTLISEGKEGHCFWCEADEFISLDLLKLKKLLNKS